MAPQRRTDQQRVKHLDAKLLPMELALNERAAALDKMATDTESWQIRELANFVSTEYRALAEELHHWL